MTKNCADCCYPPISYRRLQKVDPRDLALIRDDFGVYLRGLGYSPYTVTFYQRRMLRLANWLGQDIRRPQLTQLTRKEVPRLLNRFLPRRRPNTLTCFRKPLFQWLRFRGCFALPALQVGWQGWLDDYLDFLRIHRGVADTTIQRAQVNVSALLYNTGARISEALQIAPKDLQHRVVRLHGKGRKRRDIPLWPQTERELRRWCQDNNIAPAASVFCNREGRPISRRNANRRFDLSLTKAAAACPSLRGRKITLHTWRRTTAMHLLQAGVPLEVISLWLGHEDIATTHDYIEADLEMKRQTLEHLPAPTPWRRPRKLSSSHVLAFLEAL